MMRRVYVGIGSNLGDREFLIRKAVESLRQLPQTNVSGVSSLYDTEPVGERGKDVRKAGRDPERSDERDEAVMGRKR